MLVARPGAVDPALDSSGIAHRQCLKEEAQGDAPERRRRNAPTVEEGVGEFGDER